MKKSKLIKIITLAHFVGFIIIFILMQTNQLNDFQLSENTYLQLSPNGSGVGKTKQAEDTLKKKKQPTIASSSKSGIMQLKPTVTDVPSEKLKFDSLGNRLYDSASMMRIMGSSKSIVIFEKVIIRDSIYYRIKKGQ